MNWYAVKNPNGNILAVFPQVGQAVNFCHVNNHPARWIKLCEIKIEVEDNSNLIIAEGKQV